MIKIYKTLQKSLFIAFCLIILFNSNNTIGQTTSGGGTEYECTSSLSNPSSYSINFTNY